MNEEELIGEAYGVKIYISKKALKDIEHLSEENKRKLHKIIDQIAKKIRKAKDEGKIKNKS